MLTSIRTLDPSLKFADHDILCLSHLRWRFVFQRPQHLLSRCARTHRVFFFEEPEFDSAVTYLEVTRDETGVFVIVPHLAPKQPAPESDQVTPLFCESLCTEAVKWADVETCTEVLAGLTETEIARGAEVMMTLAAFDFVVSETEVALMVTVAGEGTLAGAM